MIYLFKKNGSVFAKGVVTIAANYLLRQRHSIAFLIMGSPIFLHEQKLF